MGCGADRVVVTKPCPPASTDTLAPTEKSGPSCIRIALCLAAIVGLLGPAQLPGQATGAEEPAPTGSVGELHLLVNQRREAAGCAALRWHEPTARIAEDHSRDMALRDYFDHVTPDGTDLAARLLSGGVTWRGSIAENIARTPAGAVSAVELWMDSPPHRASIESCEFTHHGAGVFRDRWTQVLVETPGGAP